MARPADALLAPDPTLAAGVTRRADAPLIGTSLVALGLVYGDIGVNPLYVMPECFRGNAFAFEPDAVRGVVSLIFWSLMLVVVGKYLFYLRRAERHGEGGILVLTALASAGPQRPWARQLIFALGLLGVVVFCGQAAVAPTISVLSAVETLGGAASSVAEHVPLISAATLVAFFALQRQGSRFVGLVFGPVLLVWFATLAILGARAVAATPSVLWALNPVFAFELLTADGGHAPNVLRAAFLSVTGAEALYAAVGHIGARPIRRVWVAVVGPALLLSYFGQGALVLADPRAAQQPLLTLAPDWARLPMLGLCAAVSLVAAQGVVSSAFSLARQTRLFGLLEGLELRAKSIEAAGAVYAPMVNGVVALAALGLALGFRSSSALAPTYATLVSASMTIATLLAYPVSLSWGWSRRRAALATSLFLACDLGFLAANVSRPRSGSWLLLLLAVLALFGVSAWRRAWASPPVAGCLADETIAAFVDGSLDRAGLAAIESHLAGCSTCANVVAAAASAASPSEPSPLPTADHAAPNLLPSPNAAEGSRYRRGALIGRGGMGEVYLGLDLQNDRAVAIKRLRPELAAASEETVDRFAREAEILHRLDHPNVVKILAFERGADYHDIVMELVEGGSLRDLLRAEGQLPVARALPMVLELSDALSRAHHLGVIHRDIKPENVLLAADGTPRLADFGLACMGNESIGAPNGLLGTIAYLSPEALWGRSLDERTDVWGLGVTLFEMLGGRRPFDGASHGAVMTAILHQPTPDLAAICAEASPALVALVSRMLEKDPAKRTTSARQLGAELEALLQSSRAVG